LALELLELKEAGTHRVQCGEAALETETAAAKR
jgi:hypothetical protein